MLGFAVGWLVEEKQTNWWKAESARQCLVIEAKRMQVEKWVDDSYSAHQRAETAEEALDEERAKTKWISEHAEAVVFGLRSSWEDGTVCRDLPERVTALEQVLESYAGLEATP
jgi:hypothetical protein